ncbi:putative glycosyl transferase [Kluyvera cryocrescens]|uniref:Putative glycosyl transferase n=1 Tax=Kluyvera cryocrescens TaxID=580 RepID=A0A485APR0_KLUCR|nr:putative glycosyl transferase [Kluyvera cryocrescens]
MSALLQRQKRAQALPTPFVSVVCPTYNRREFLPYLLYIWQYQDYPADKRELIILDDSPASNADLIAMMSDPSQPNVRYIHSPERLVLGQKRNMLNELATGEYIICFDDDGLLRAE